MVAHTLSSVPSACSWLWKSMLLATIKTKRTPQRVTESIKASKVMLAEPFLCATKDLEQGGPGMRHGIHLRIFAISQATRF